MRPAILIGVRVRAMMVRGTKGEIPLCFVSGDQATDDRGIYRMYGLDGKFFFNILPPGRYLTLQQTTRPREPTQWRSCASPNQWKREQNCGVKPKRRKLNFN
jgi:hypothetical protein